MTNSLLIILECFLYIANTYIIYHNMPERYFCNSYKMIKEIFSIPMFLNYGEQLFVDDVRNSNGKTA